MDTIPMSICSNRNKHSINYTAVSYFTQVFVFVHLHDILDLRLLSPHTKIDLREVDWQQVKESFNEMQKGIKKSLQSRKVKPKDVVATLKCCEETHHLLEANQTIFLEIKEKCLACKSFSDFWFIIEDFFTFYSYVILRVIVKSELAVEADREMLSKYDKEFESYSMTVLKKYFSGDFTISDTKTDITVKIRGVYSKFSSDHLYEFKKKLAFTLKVETHLLHLNFFEKGCILLTYHAPFILEIAAFPLSTEQEESLKELEVIWLHCGKYRFPSAEVCLVQCEHKRGNFYVFAQ